MPVEWNEEALAQLSPADRAALEAGTLDRDLVFIQYLCSTDGHGTEHDPNKPPDNRVRPSHAALHARIFRLEDAPTPPLDWGCRCAIRYLPAPAAPEPVRDALGAEPPKEQPTTPQQATRDWLQANVPQYEKIAQAAQRDLPDSGTVARDSVGDRVSRATLAARRLGVPQPRHIARMVVDTLAPPPEALARWIGPGTGVGASGARLALQAVAGSLAAARRLARSYPATYLRLLAESNMIQSAIGRDQAERLRRLAESVLANRGG